MVTWFGGEVGCNFPLHYIIAITALHRYLGSSNLFTCLTNFPALILGK